MKRVTGLGGIFFRSEDPAATRKWYEQHLGIPKTDYGTSFSWRHLENPDKKGFTAFNAFPQESEYMEPSDKDVMINFRVADLQKLLVVLKEEGIDQIGEMETFEYGKFAWIMDPNGIKIELWEPADEVYDDMDQSFPSS